MAHVDLAAYLRERRAYIDRRIDGLLPPASAEPRPVSEAMRYATLGGGKRLRPILALAVADVAGVAHARIADAACAIELVHSASLILDDLPSMDNASSRRGRPCVHRRFGESTAILAAMDLIALSFERVAINAEHCGRPVRPAVTALSRAIGHGGIVRGQHADLALGNGAVSLEQLESVYRHKAGALFLAAVELPAYLLGVSEGESEALCRYAADVGLAFQITDDLLDAAHPGEDGDRGTFVTHLGREGAHEKAKTLLARSVSALDGLRHGDGPLRMLAEYVGTRTT